MQKLKSLVQKATATPKKRYLSLSIIGLVFLLIGFGVYYWSINKKSIIKAGIDKSLLSKTGGLYQISYDKFDLDEVAGSLHITNLAIRFDSSVFYDQKAIDTEPSVVMNLFIPGIMVKAVQTPRALINKEIVGDNVDLINPTIELVYTQKGKDSSRVVPREEIFRQLLTNFQLLKFRQISIRNAHLFTRRMDHKDTLLNVRDLSLVLDYLLIDSSSSSDSSRLLFSKNIACTIASISWGDKKRLYRYQMDSLSFNSSQKFVATQKFDATPILSEKDFMRKRGVQTDRLNIHFKNIRLMRVDFRELMDQALVADSLTIGSLNISVYKDMSLPRDHENRIGTFPHQKLMELPFAVDIRKGFVQNSYIEYKQFTPKTRAMGKIDFHHLSLKINNITNRAASILRNRICRVDAYTKFLNITPLNASFLFDMGAKDGAFEARASLGPLSASSLTKVAEPFASAKIEKGIINGLKVEINGNDYTGHARITMKYQGLKIAVLQLDEKNGTLQKKGFISAAANIIVRNNNPDKNGNLRVGTGVFERDRNRSFFNLIWKSIFVAVAETLGTKASSKPNN